MITRQYDQEFVETPKGIFWSFFQCIVQTFFELINARCINLRLLSRVFWMFSFQFSFKFVQERNCNERTEHLHVIFRLCIQFLMENFHKLEFKTIQLNCTKNCLIHLQMKLSNLNLRTHKFNGRYCVPINCANIHAKCVFFKT